MLSDIPAPSFGSPMTTADSAASGRLKVGVGTSKNKLVRQTIKNYKAKPKKNIPKTMRPDPSLLKKQPIAPPETPMGGMMGGMPPAPPAGMGPEAMPPSPMGGPPPGMNPGMPPVPPGPMGMPGKKMPFA